MTVSTLTDVTAMSAADKAKAERDEEERREIAQMELKLQKKRDQAKAAQAMRQWEVTISKPSAKVGLGLDFLSNNKRQLVVYQVVPGGFMDQWNNAAAVTGDVAATDEGQRLPASIRTIIGITARGSRRTITSI